MATVLVSSVLDKTNEKKKELFQNISDALSATFPKYSLYYESVDPACVAGYAKHQVNIIICVPPYMSMERKREVNRNLHAAVTKTYGELERFSVIVLFKYHPDDCCGVDGVLRADAKAAAAVAGK